MEKVEWIIDTELITCAFAPCVLITLCISDQMLTIHYYLLFDGPDEHWQHIKSLYNEGSTFRCLSMKYFYFITYFLEAKLSVLEGEGLAWSNIVGPFKLI